MTAETRASCDDFKDALRRWIEGNPDALSGYGFETHLGTCDSCLMLWSRLQGEGPDLVHPVLNALGLDACQQAREDLSLGHTNAFMADHLAACDACGTLAKTLHDLSSELVGLRELDPGPAFAAQVLEATLPQRTRIKPRRFWLSGLLKRPRFAFEFAYILTLLVFVMTPLDARALGKGIAYLGQAAVSIDGVSPEVAAGARDLTRATLVGIADLLNGLGDVCHRTAQRVSEWEVELWPASSGERTETQEHQSKKENYDVPRDQ